MSKDKPEIRFAGYTEAWEKRKLGEFAEKVIDNRGKTPPTSEQGDYSLLEVAAIGGYYPDYSKVSKYVNKEIFNNWFRAHPQKGDILFSTVGNTGLTTIMDDHRYVTIAQNIVGFRAKKDYAPEFLLQMFKLPENLKKAKRIEMGAVQPSIKVSQLIDVKYDLPSSGEQQKIGLIFKQMDNIITVNQRKVDLLKELKKGFLQKMFPKNGEDKPEIRFGGYTDAWEKRKMSEMFKITRGKVLSVDKVSPFSNSEYRYPVYSSQTKNNGLVGFYNSFLFENAITWTTDGANAGTVNYRPEKFFSTNVNGVLLEKQQRPNQIIAEALNKVAYRFVSKVGNPKLMNNVMADIVISVPIDMKEQQQMSDLFSKLDNLVVVNQRRVDLLKQEKKALLQKMFV